MDLKTKASVTTTHRAIHNCDNPIFSDLLAGRTGSNIKKEYWDALVKSWDCKEKAIEWASKNSISLYQLASPTWILKRAKKSKDHGGIECSLHGLYKAIRRDQRFKDFSDFQKFLELEMRCDFGSLVKSWDTKEKAIEWAKSKGISLQHFRNPRWLAIKSSQTKQMPRIVKTLYPLYRAVKKDPRFRDFSDFQKFIGLEDCHDYIALVASWDTKEKAVEWATGKGISFQQLRNPRWLSTESAKSREKGGIGQPLFPLYFAIRKDKRFSDFLDFQKFLGLEEVYDYRALVKSWDTKEKAIEWATSKGISLQKFRNHRWLVQWSAKPKEQGGVGQLLYPLYVAIRTDPRFGNFSKFQLFLGPEEYNHYSALVQSWDTKEKAIEWASRKGISVGQLGNPRWLRIDSAESKTNGGIGESLYPLFKAIRKDNRFYDFLKFKKFLGLNKR